MSIFKKKTGGSIAARSLTKKTVITIFTLIMFIMGVIIVVYHNPLADPVDEIIKKVMVCSLLVAAVFVFDRFYDKITVLPFELYSNRRLI